MYNLLSKHATELAKEIGDTKVPTVNHYTEHIHCTYIKASQIPVLAILKVKNIFLLIHPCFPSEETRTEKIIDQLKLTQWFGAGIRIQIQISRLSSQGLFHKATGASHQFRYIWASTVFTVMQSPKFSQAAISPQSYCFLTWNQINCSTQFNCSNQLQTQQLHSHDS